MNNKTVFLDVDTSIVENNLRIAQDPNEEEFNKLFQQPPDQYPSKVVKPSPGCCIKTKEVGTETKVFVNICLTDAIPAPEDISEVELVGILNSDDASHYRIPMSIGEVREEPDKKGASAKAIDVAINPTFYQKIEGSPLFKNFFTAVAFEGLREKYGIHTTDERIVLRNRKAYGTLQAHRIQQREVAQKMGLTAGPSPYDEMTGLGETSKGKPKIETLSSVTYEGQEDKIPEYRLFKKRDEPNFLIGEFKLPDVITSKEITLDVGEDRIILESQTKGYLLDIYIPHLVNEEHVSSTFNRDSKILTVTMPIKVA